MQRYLNKYTAIFTLTILAVLFTLPNVTKAGSISLPPNNLGLVGYWSMEDGAGTTATDFSGNGNTGTLTNMDANTDWVPGKIGTALEFDGVDDYVDIVDDTSLNFNSQDSFTISTWIKTDASLGIIFSDSWITAGTNKGYIFYISNGLLKFFVSSGGGGAIGGGGIDYHEGTITLHDNNWHNVVVTYSNKLVKFYIDGIFDNSKTFIIDSTVFSEINYGQLIGANFNTSNGNFSNHFNGSIDDVRIYNRALSATEISTLYSRSKRALIKSGVSNEGLVGYWSMEGTQDTSVDDYSGNGNIGTMTNMDTGTDYVTGYKEGSTALDFDGVDDSVISTTDSNLNFAYNDPWTMSAWIKASPTLPALFGGIVAHSSANCLDDKSYYMVLYNTGGGMKLYTIIQEYKQGGANNYFGKQGTQDLNDDTWHFVTTTYTGTYASDSSMVLYVDGVEETIGATPRAGGTPTLSNQPVRIGEQCGSSAGSRSFNGSIDDVRIYNRALSATEIGKLYNQTKTTKINVSQNNKLTDGLVGLWSFNGQDISGTTAYDRSGQGNDGTLTNGPTPVAGKIGQALEFDGADDYVAVATPPTLVDTDPFSVCHWFKLSEFGVSTVMSDLASATNSRFRYATVVLSSNKLDFTLIKQSVGGLDVIGNTTISDTNWHHFCGTSDGTTNTNSVKLYLDGALDGQGTRIITGAIPDVQVLKIGSDYVGTSNFAGPIDEYRIYNYVLSTKEIQQLYGQGR